MSSTYTWIIALTVELDLAQKHVCAAWSPITVSCSWERRPAEGTPTLSLCSNSRGASNTPSPRLQPTAEVCWPMTSWNHQDVRAPGRIVVGWTRWAPEECDANKAALPFPSVCNDFSAVTRSNWEALLKTPPRVTNPPSFHTSKSLFSNSISVFISSCFVGPNRNFVPPTVHKDQPKWYTWRRK